MIYNLDSNKYEIMGMYIDNVSARDICDYFDVKPPTLLHRLRKWGVYDPERCKRRITADQHEFMIDQHKLGLSAVKIGKVMGISQGYISRQILKYKEAVFVPLKHTHSQPPGESFADELLRKSKASK